MQPVLRAWTRYQWAGERPTQDPSLSSLDDDVRVEEWNLCQWVGERPDGTRTPPWTPDPVVDTSGGFSGFGHADSGGQRWASTTPRASVGTRPEKRVELITRAAA